MENIKVLATPKAYELINTDGERVQEAMQYAMKLALGKLPKLRQIKCPAMCIENSPLEMTMQWADKPENESIILISHQNEPYFLLDSVKLSDAIKTAIPIAVV